MLPGANKTIQLITSYILDSIGLPVLLAPWPDSENLPLLLREQYLFYILELQGSHCLLFLKNTKDVITPGTVVKHCKLLAKYWNKGIIYSTATLSAMDRIRLVKANVPFIIPQKQLYLPFLGVDFKEIFPPEKKNGDYLSPTAQVLLIGKLYKKGWIGESPSKIAEKLKITKMSTGRAFSELAERELAAINLTGREKKLSFVLTGKQLWNKALPLLKTPVTSKIKVAHYLKDIEMYTAGLPGLSCYSLLQAPGSNTVAVWNRSFKKDGIIPGKKRDMDDDMEVEKWSYNPGIFAEKGTADPLSIYLSLQNMQDERIEMALDELLENIKW